MAAPTELPEDYYHSNFQQMIDWVNQHYLDLLTADELHWLHGYQRLSRAAQMLYIRLISRKGPIFRLDQLNYAEIGDIETAAAELLNSDLATTPAQLSLDDCHQLFTRADFVQLFSQFDLAKSTSKQQWLSQLAHVADLDTRLAEIAVQQRLIEVVGQQQLGICKLLFLGNPWQDLDQMVITALGHVRYAKVTNLEQQRFFHDRAMLDCALCCHQLSRQLDEYRSKPPLELVQRCIDQLPATPTHSWLKRRYGKLINRLAKALEQHQQLEQALALYQRTDLAPSPERQIRLLAKQDQLQQALKQAEQLAQQPQDVSEQEFCQRFIPQLKRKLGGPPVKRQAQQFNSELLSLKQTEQRVELQVLAYYQHHGWQGYWLENQLVGALFAQLFWDIIFVPIEGAFCHPFQQAPLDLHSADFYRLRQPLIEQRLAQLSDTNFVQQQLEQVQRDCHGISNSLFNWKQLPKQAVQQLATRLSTDQLTALMQPLCFDLASYRSGLPDLFLFKDNQPDYLLAEVKGPGDSLSDNQKRWLSIFQQQGIHHRVIHVEWDAPPPSIQQGDARV